MARKFGDSPQKITNPSPELVLKVGQILEQVRSCLIKSVSVEILDKRYAALVPLSIQSGFSQAVAHHLESEESIIRLYAAHVLYGLGHGTPASVSPELAKRCEDLLVEALQSPEPETQALATQLLANWELPKQVIAPLRKQMNSRNPTLALIAAIALGRSPEAEPEARRALMACLDAEGPKVAAYQPYAAGALLHMGLLDARVLSAVKEHFQSGTPVVKRAFLIAAYGIGQRVSALYELFAPILLDVSQEPKTRHWSAAALGSISRGTGRATPLLLDALRSRVNDLIEGAALGLAASSDLPSVALNIIRDQLVGPRSECRRAAATAVQVLSRFCSGLVPVLIQRLSEEVDKEVLSALSQALVEIGKPAVRPLLDALDDATFQVEEYVGIALASIGFEAAEMIEEILISSGRNQRKFQFLLNVLAQIGSNAAPAIPSMTLILEHVVHEHLVLDAVRILHNCGPAAAPAIPAMVCHIANRYSEQNDVDFWVRRTLLSNPADASREARLMLRTATGPARERLEALLVELEAKPVTTGRLDGFPDIEQLKQFVAMAEVLKDGPLSMRDVGKKLKEAAPVKSGKYRGLSTTTVDKARRAIQAWLDAGPLVAGSKTKPYQLTDLGKEIAQEAIQKLQASLGPNGRDLT